MERHAAERPAVLDDLTGPRPAERPRQVDEGDRRSFAGHVAGYGPDRAAGEAVWDRFAAGGPDHLAEPVGPDDHVRGPATAPATVVVYGDYQCPYTRRALREIARLERRLGDRFRLVVRRFPLLDRLRAIRSPGRLRQARPDFELAEDRAAAEEADEAAVL